MDELSIAVLKAELAADCRVLQRTAALARARFGSGTDAELEACAFHLARAYNLIEQMGLRIAKAFENRLDDDRGWHSGLIQRLSIAIPDVRPAFFSAGVVPDLQELRGFRHVVRHAYDLTLRKDRMSPVLEAAEGLAERMPRLCDSFFASLTAQ